MRIIHLIIPFVAVVLFHPLLVAQQDTSKSVKTSIDSISISRQVPLGNAMETTWIQKYAPSFIGTLLGSLIAGLIAVYSVRATHQRSIARDGINAERLKQQRQSRYCGLLFSIHSILQSHNELTNILVKELTDIRDQSVQKMALIIDSTTTRIPIAFMEQCLLKTLEYETFETRLVGNIISYQHYISNLNANLNFSPILKLESSFKNRQLYIDAIKDYFDQLIQMVGKADNARNDLMTSIQTELKHFPFVTIVDHT